MKIVYMGTPEIAATVLESIIGSGEHTVCAVVTQVDKPKGRGHEMGISEVKEVALRYGIPVLQPEKTGTPEFIDTIRGLAPDAIVVTAYGKILRPSLLSIPKYGCINVHASLLPKLRGAAPIQWAVLLGEKKSGVTIMHMAEGIDTGDMILQKEVELDEKETAGSLHDKLAKIGGPTLLEALRLIEEGKAPRIPQDDSESTYVGMIDKSLGNMDFNETSDKLERLIRGLDPWPSAYTRLNGKLLKIWKADACPGDAVPSAFAHSNPGTVVNVAADSFDVKCKKGLLRVYVLQPEGKKRMTAGEFLRGYGLPLGTVLGDSHERT